MKKSHLLIGSIVLLVLLIIAVIVSQSPTGPDQTAQTPPAGTAELPTAAPTPTPTQPKPVAKPPTTPATTNKLVVTGSQQSGGSIVISSVSLTAPAFAVVYEATSDRDNPTFGKMLAASSLLPKGTSYNVAVKMTTSPGELYLVALQRDNGNKVFGSQEDVFVTDASGEPIVAKVTADAATVTSPKTVYVDLRGSVFAPASITVNKGDSVLFANRDSYPHTVTATAFGGRHLLQVGQTYVLETASLPRGTYRYTCEFHPGMAGTIIVK